MRNFSVCLGAALLLLSCGGGQNDFVQAPSEPPLSPSGEQPGVSNNTDPAEPAHPANPGQEVHGEQNFADLMNHYLQGKVEPTPWAGFWWPEAENGVASGKYSSTHKSPAGKFDAAHGNKTMAQLWEVNHHGIGQKNHKIEGWEGHCNGWSVASALFPEPQGPAKVNGVQFEVKDIKALLSEAGMNASADYFGEPVIGNESTSSPRYKDTVPGQAFLVLTNYIGKRKQAVLFDRVTDYQKWNHPFAGYRFEYPTPKDYLGATPEAPDVYRILVKGTIWYVDDGFASNDPTPAFNFESTADGLISSRVLTMELWLDAPVVFDSSGKMTSSGNIIVTRDPRDPRYFVGGEWRMDDVADYSQRWPDYMWVPFSILPTNEDNANPYIDVNWLKDHLLVPGGVDDPSCVGCNGNVADPPSTTPSPSPRPSASPAPHPSPQPPHPSPSPVPFPRPSPFP